MAFKRIYRTGRIVQGYRIAVPCIGKFIVSTSSKHVIPDYSLRHYEWGQINTTSLPDGVRFCKYEQGGILASLGENIAVRLELNGENHTNRSQHTRTFGLYGYFDGKAGALFDDIPSATDNIVLARVYEGYESHRSTGRWVLPKSDKHVKDTLERTIESYKQVSASPRFMNLPLREISVVSLEKDAHGRTEFGRKIEPIVGNAKLAEMYSGWLGYYSSKRRDYSSKEHVLLDRQTDICSINPPELKRLGVDKNHVEVRTVSLGPIEVDYHYVCAANEFTVKCTSARALVPMRIKV